MSQRPHTPPILETTQSEELSETINTLESGIRATEAVVVTHNTVLGEVRERRTSRER